jgi:hypothetical protein
MAIFIDDCMCIGIIKVASLNKLFPGGTAQFIEAVGGRSCTDGELVLVDSMSEMDIVDTFQKLAEYDLKIGKDFGGLDETWISRGTRTVVCAGMTDSSTLQIVSLADSSLSPYVIHGCSGQIRVH